MEAEGEEVDVAPGGVLGYDAGEDAGEENAEQVARDDNGECYSAAMRWGQVTDEREHYLRRHSGDGREEGDA